MTGSEWRVVKVERRMVIKVGRSVDDQGQGVIGKEEEGELVTVMWVPDDEESSHDPRKKIVMEQTVIILKFKTWMGYVLCDPSSPQ